MPRYSSESCDLALRRRIHRHPRASLPPSHRQLPASLPPVHFTVTISVKHTPCSNVDPFEHLNSTCSISYSTALSQTLIIRTKLKKLPLDAASLLPDSASFRPSPEQEAQWLRAKHLAASLGWDSVWGGQKPLMGSGGVGAKMREGLEDIKEKLHDLEEEVEDEERYWAQMMEGGGMSKRMLKGDGHGVPLSGARCDLPTGCR